MNLGSALSIPSVNHRLDLLARSVRFLSCGKLKRASQLIADAVNSHPDDSEDVREIIAACQRLGIIVQSRKFLSKADVLLMAGDFENAFRKYLLIGIAGLPRDISFQALHNKAVCLVRLNLFGEAIENFQEALLRFPKDTLCLQHLAFALMMNRDFSAALQVFSELIRIDEIKPENLLHILYGAAECRQRLNLGENTGEMADHTLHAIQQHQELHVRHHQTGYFSDDNGDDESYNDYGLAEFGDEVLQNVAHVKQICVPAAVAPMQSRATVHIQENSAFRPSQSQSQFRRLRYQPETKMQPRSSLSIDTGVEKPARRGDEDGSQSPQLSVQSKQKREALRRVVGAYDRSVLVTSPVQQGQVRAAVPTLIHRERGTDPSPGHCTTTESANRSTGVLKCGVQESPRDPERTGGGISSSQSVSSSKPKLSRHTHRRHNTHVEFAPPVLPTPPPHTEKITAKPEAIRVDVRYPELPVEKNGDADAKAGPAKLAPANPMAAPMFVASPLPVPHWRPQERVSTTIASFAPPRAPTPPVQATTAQPVPRPIAHLTMTSEVGTVPLAKQVAMSPAAPPPQIAVVPPRQQHAAVQHVESAQSSEPLPDPLLGFRVTLSAPLEFSKTFTSEPIPATSLRRALPHAPAPTQQLRLPTSGVAATTSLPGTSTLTLSATQSEPASCASASDSLRLHSSAGKVHGGSPPLEGTLPHMVDTERVVGPEQLVARENSSGSSASSNSLDLPDYLRAAGLSPPVLSDLSSSEPPPSIKAAVQASHKPRRPSLSSLPDLDFTSQPAYLGAVVQKDFSPLVDLNELLHTSAKETHPGTQGTLLTLHSQQPHPSRSSAMITSAAPLLQPWTSVPLVLPRGVSHVSSGLKASAATHSNVRTSCIGDGDVKSHTSSVTGASQISAISTDSSSSGYASENLTDTFRYSGTQARSQPNSSVASEQQQEMDRVFEGRRYVDNYTVTNADVIKLHAEFQRRFPSSNGPPTVTYPYAALRSPGPYPPDVDIRIREMYLSDAEFQALFHTSKTNWLSLPEWRQRSLKKSLELF